MSMCLKHGYTNSKSNFILDPSMGGVRFQKIPQVTRGELVRPPSERCACVGSSDNNMAETYTHGHFIDVNALFSSACV